MKGPDKTLPLHELLQTLPSVGHLWRDLHNHVFINLRVVFPLVSNERVSTRRHELRPSSQQPLGVETRYLGPAALRAPSLALANLQGLELLLPLALEHDKPL